MSDLRNRIQAAMLRIGAGHAAMRIPADPTDPDIVLGEAAERIAALEAALKQASGALSNATGGRPEDRELIRRALALIHELLPFKP